MTEIPKVIHYIWVGGKPFPKTVERCIESWKQFAPDYELKLWSEENAPMHHPYARAMYAKGKWAFVSDYIRFWALEREGGVYLDTDMEILRPIDAFLSDSLFMGKTKDGYVACGIIGAVPHHPAIQKMLEFYQKDMNFSTEMTSPKVATRVLTEGNFTDISVYDPTYFYPCDDGERCGSEVLARAFATHHWAESWVPFAGVRKVLRRLGIMPILKRLLKKRV